MISQDMECPEDMPPDVFDSFKRHALDRGPTGGFVHACLANDFMEALSHADDEYLPALLRIAQFIHCDLPTGCHGSYEKVRAWLASG